MYRGDMHVTNIEQVVKDWLDAHNVLYIFQRPTRIGFVDDFYIETENIIIEVDGVHWHSSQKAKKKNKFRDYMNKRTGVKTLRIKEESISDIDSILAFLIKS